RGRRRSRRPRPARGTARALRAALPAAARRGRRRRARPRRAARLARMRDADGYLPIAEHGVIGDLHTVALVGVDGTIDWYCTPRFDAPSVFASILDARRGGARRVAPVAGGAVKRPSFPGPHVPTTRALSPE